MLFSVRKNILISLLFLVLCIQLISFLKCAALNTSQRILYSATGYCVAVSMCVRSKSKKYYAVNGQNANRWACVASTEHRDVSVVESAWLCGASERVCAEGEMKNSKQDASLENVIEKWLFFPFARRVRRRRGKTFRILLNNAKRTTEK